MTSPTSPNVPAAPVLLTGGTGTLGRHVVPLLRAAGCDLRILSRRRHEPADGIEYLTGDLFADEGIEPAVPEVIGAFLAAGREGRRLPRELDSTHRVWTSPRAGAV